MTTIYDVCEHDWNNELRGAHPPPGLLISLGDGRAVECTAEILANAWARAESRSFAGSRTTIAREAIDCLIQQAQEKR